MDVQAVSTVSAAQAQYSSAAKTQEKAAEETKGASSAVVDFGASTAQRASATYSRAKGLSADQVKAFQEYRANNDNQFIQMMMNMQGNVQKQGQQFLAANNLLNLSGGKITASMLDLPAGGSTPAEAAAAISDGGAYSIDAVATRIFSLAEAIAGDDPEKLQEMRDAVNKGFEQAGFKFKSVTKSGLPQISHDTYDEIMSRFDKLQEKLQAAKDGGAQDTPDTSLE